MRWDEVFTIGEYGSLVLRGAPDAYDLVFSAELTLNLETIARLGADLDQMLAETFEAAVQVPRFQSETRTFRVFLKRIKETQHYQEEIMKQLKFKADCLCFLFDERLNKLRVIYGIDEKWVLMALSGNTPSIRSHVALIAISPNNTHIYWDREQQISEILTQLPDLKLRRGTFSLEKAEVPYSIEQVLVSLSKLADLSLIEVPKYLSYLEKGKLNQ